jgi:hypothetical protein
MYLISKKVLCFGRYPSAVFRGTALGVNRIFGLPPNVRPSAPSAAPFSPLPVDVAGTISGIFELRCGGVSPGADIECEEIWQIAKNLGDRHHLQKSVPDSLCPMRWIFLEL